MQSAAPAGTFPSWPLLLFLSGVNLSIIQFSSLRALSPILFGTELTLFLIAFAYFLGFSAGYGIVSRLSPRALALCAALQWFTHLTLPFSLRWLAGWLSGQGWKSSVLFSALFLGSFWASSFYSALLPLALKRTPAERPLSFGASYSLELLGAAFGLVLAGALPRLHPAALMGVYHLILALILRGFWASRLLFAAALSGALVYAVAFNRLESSSVLYYYRQARAVEPQALRFSADTPYQRVEILEDEDGDRHLYLDGIRHYGSESLSEFNYYIAGLPTRLLAPARALIVGSGSFAAARQALAHAGSVLSVELDPVVARAGGRWLAPEGWAERSGGRWSLAVDDAKHYLGRLEGKVGLIALDIAGPFQRQVALLYTQEFLALARSRLEPGGALALCLNGDLASGAYTARRVAATLLSRFPEVFVILREDGRASFALAGEGLPFQARRISEALRASGRAQARVLDRAGVEKLLASGEEARPISLGRLDIVLKRAWPQLTRRFFPRREEEDE